MSSQDGPVNPDTSEGASKGVPGRTRLAVVFDRCLCGQHDSYVVVVTFNPRRTQEELAAAAALVMQQVSGVNGKEIDQGESEIRFNLTEPFDSKEQATVVARNIQTILQLGDVELEQRTEGEPLTDAEAIALMWYLFAVMPRRRRGPTGSYWRNHVPPWGNSGTGKGDPGE